MELSVITAAGVLERGLAPEAAVLSGLTLTLSGKGLPQRTS